MSKTQRVKELEKAKELLNKSWGILEQAGITEEEVAVNNSFFRLNNLLEKEIEAEKKR